MSPKQFGELIDARAPALLLYARQWCDAPEDVVQDAFLKLLSQRTAPTDVGAWLFRVVRNGAVDAARSKKRRLAREQAVAREARWFVDADTDGLDAELAADALKDLPLEQREVIVAHLWGGLTFEQIGQVSGGSASTCHRLYHAGLGEMRRRLRAQCPNP